MDIRDKIDNNEYTLKQDYGSDRKTYRNDLLCLINQFHDDLIAELGWDRFPNAFAAALVQRAWDKGHDMGFLSVVECAEDLDDFFDEWNVVPR